MQILVWETSTTWDYNPRPMSTEEASIWLNHYRETNPGITYKVLTRKSFYQWLVQKIGKVQAKEVYLEVYGVPYV